MYAKLFGRITESSLMEEAIPTRYTFVMLLAVADPTGHVIGTDVAIARRLNMPLKEFEKCVAELMQPDPDSNSKEEGGKRVVPSEGERGYRLVNYVAYRDMRDEDQRREYMRNYMREYRASKRPVNTVSDGERSLAQAEEEASAPEVSKRSTSSHPSPRSGEVEEVVAYYVSKKPRSRPGAKERGKILARLKEGISVERMKEAIDGCLARPFVNDAGKTFDGLELIVRDSAKVNQFAEAPKGPIPKPHETPYGQGVSKKELPTYSPWGS